LKKILLCLLIAATLASQVNAQTGVITDDFEGNGTITTWFGDHCMLNTSLANTFKQGINTSSTVMDYTDTGGLYANVRFETGFKLEMDSYYVFSLKIYIPSNGITGNQTNQISLKLQDGSQGAPWETQCEIIKPALLDQWQTISFDFKNDAYKNLNAGSLPPTQRSDFSRIVLQVNGEGNNDHVRAYIDDFYYNGKVKVEPTYNHLVWSDEFNSDGPIDQSKWYHQTQLPAGGSWYNGEIQHYTNRIENSSVSNGILNLVAIKESFTDQNHTKQYTSARLNSKFAFTYGRVEIRAKLPTGVGTWPAIWMLGKNINEDGAYWDNLGFDKTPWPACGEIDIMEHWGSNQNFVQSAMHTPSSFGNTVNHGGRILSTASNNFHNYSLKWTPDKMVFMVDSIVHYVYEPETKDANTWPFDADQYMILNIAIQASIDPSFSSSAMNIDYIRVYQDKPITDVKKVSPIQGTNYPNPFSHSFRIKTGASNMEPLQCTIYNHLGKMVFEKNTQTDAYGSVQIDASHLPKGVYLLRYSLGGKEYRSKLVKN